MPDDTLKKTYKMTLYIYISRYNLIGGVETFVTNFCKRMSKHYDITLLFDNAESIDLLIEASKYVDVVKLEKDKTYSCDVFINSTAWGYEPYKHIQSKYQIQIVHADYSYYISGWNFKYQKHENTTHHVCVGETVKEAFEKATPYKCDAVIYNLLDNSIKPTPKKKSDKLKLVTVSRISGEKGFDRMLQLAEQLNENNIAYEWDVYGNCSGIYAQAIKRKFEKLKQVNFRGITREPFKVMDAADYLVQLSDTEGFAYSVYEAMQIKTPCLITPFTSGNEQIKHGENGYILPFDMKNINFDEIINCIPVVSDFEELGKEQDWINFINTITDGNTKSKKKGNR